MANNPEKALAHANLERWWSLLRFISDPQTRKVLHEMIAEAHAILDKPDEVEA